jgi:hypothetical protein
MQKVYIEKLLNVADRGRIAFYPSKITVCGEESFGVEETCDLLCHKTKEIKLDLRVPTLYWNEIGE